MKKILFTLLLLPMTLLASEINEQAVKEVELLNDMRVARIDQHDSKPIAVIMLLSKKEHYRLHVGASFEPEPGYLFKLASIEDDGTIVVRTTDGAEVSVYTITEQEKEEYKARHRHQ